MRVAYAKGRVVKPPEFLRVRPADVGRVGPLGACILAAIRYVTTLPVETNGRRVIDGRMWWRASASEIAEAVGGGVSARTVSRAVLELLETGDLEAVATQDFFGDRARAYKASDQPSDKNDTGSDQPSDNMADRSDILSDRIGQNVRAPETNCLTTSDKMSDLPSVGELEESKEPPYPPNDEPSPPQPLRKTGSEVARAKFAATPVSQSSQIASRIAHAYSQSLPVPIEAGVLNKIGIEADRCLRSQIPPEAIAAGIREWADSDSWSPTQIPTFVAKAAARTGRTTKPTETALGYQDAAETLIARLESA